MNKIFQNIVSVLDTLSKITKILVLVEVLISTINHFIKEVKEKVPELEETSSKDAK